MKKKNEPRYRLRWKSVGNTRWVPSAWATNSLTKARAMAKKRSDNPSAQVWDYKKRQAL